MHISEARLVLVDVETTGLSPKDHRVIEIAALSITDGKVNDTFQSLIDPQTPLPRQIQRLTGIRQTDVDRAPIAGDVIPAFLEFLGDGIFVAHNANFDWQMIHGELSRLDLPALANPRLCTVLMARRLLPKLPSKSLGNLAKFYGLNTGGLHRALMDAHTTAAILDRLLKRLHSVYGVSDVEAVLRFQRQNYSKLQRPKQHLVRIRSEVLPRVPDGPGVYALLDNDGKILYVGRSKNLQQRIRSYFSGVEGHPAHTRKLVQATRDVQWQTTRTELEAMLLESRRIKACKPRFNRVATDYRHRPSLRLGRINHKPWLTVVHYVRNDGGEYFGPYGSRRAAETIASMLIRLFGASSSSSSPSTRIPGAGLTAARVGGRMKESALDPVRAFLAGGRAEVLDMLDARMRRAASTQNYELATEYRDWHSFVESMHPDDLVASRSILDRNGAAIVRGEHGWKVHFFAFGRPIESKVLADNAVLSSAPIDELMQAVANPPQRLSVQHIDELALFAQWLRQVADGVRLLWLADCADGQDFERAIRKILDSKPSVDQTNGRALGKRAQLES